MIRPLPAAARRVLRDGVLCYLASSHPAGPHVTPVVYAVHASRLWVTTARRSVKARTWRRDDRVGGLVRAGDHSLAFEGRVAAYDLLEPTTWPRSVLHAPAITRAATAFTARNARFFAGYAIDAYRVPLAWTPPGRVFAAVAFDRIAEIEDGAVRKAWGGRGGRAGSATAFRMTSGANALSSIPPEVRRRVGEGGPGVLALAGGRSPVVLPARWLQERGGIYAVVPAAVLSLARGGPDLPASLVIDHASTWRARAMAGVLAQGEGRVHRISRLRSGARSAERLAARAGLDPAEAAIVSLHPRRLVWWRGWDSGTVAT